MTGRNVDWAGHGTRPNSAFKHHDPGPPDFGKAIDRALGGSAGATPDRRSTGLRQKCTVRLLFIRHCAQSLYKGISRQTMSAISPGVNDQDSV